MLDFYDYPVKLWRKVLGKDMHYHSGHFLNLYESLAIGENRAVTNLVSLLPARPRSKNRILDVGCGWGGPAFQLARFWWDCEVLGIALNKGQVDYVNRRAQKLTLPVRAIQGDIETMDITALGEFDIVLAYESLEHMVRRQKVLAKLKDAAGVLALAGYCRKQSIAKDELTKNFFEIPFLESKAELISLLEQTGWNLLALMDRTQFVLPTFAHWSSNLKQAKLNYPEAANNLIQAHALTLQSISEGRIQSVQLVAKRGK